VKPRQLVRPIISVLLLGLTVLGLVNVYGDHSEVEVLAKSVACGGTDCPTQLTRVDRNPLSHSYDLVAKPKGPKNTPSLTVSVSCQRAYVLVGAWSCTKTP